MVQFDKIYGTNKDRNWYGERGIRMTDAKKGKQPELTKYQKEEKSSTKRTGIKESLVKQIKVTTSTTSKQS